MLWLVDLDPQCLLNKNRKWNFLFFGNYIWQLPYYRKLLLHEMNANLQNLCHPWNSIHKTNVQKNGSGSLRTWSLGCLWKQLHNVYFTHAVSLICMHACTSDDMYTVYILLIFFRKSGVPQGYKGATFHRYVVVYNAIGIHLILDWVYYLTIIPRAWMGYLLRGYEGERNNCFSKIQLVGQKYRGEKKFS